jgi:hypothetical protein
MRIARNIAAVVALATIGFAVGDFASHPNALGAIGLLLLIAVFAFLLSYLFRTRVEPEAKPDTPPAPAADPPKRTRAETVWTGWNAEEAEVARQERRERRRRG